MNLALNTFTYARDSGLAVAQEALRLGFDGLGLFSRHADELRSQGFREARVVGEYVEFLAPDSAVASLRSRMDLARDCGACWLALVPSAAWRSLHEWRPRLRASLASLAEHARSLQLILALEPLHPSCAGVTCLTDAKLTLELLDGLAEGQLGWVLDTAHVTRPEEALAVPDALERLVSVHLADVHTRSEPEERCLPGDGVIELEAIVSALRRSGYNGWFEVELQGAEAARGPLADHMSKSYERARRLLAEAGT